MIELHLYTTLMITIVSNGSKDWFRTHVYIHIHIVVPNEAPLCLLGFHSGTNWDSITTFRVCKVLIKNIVHMFIFVWWSLMKRSYVCGDSISLNSPVGSLTQTSWATQTNYCPVQGPSNQKKKTIYGYWKNCCIIFICGVSVSVWHEKEILQRPWPRVSNLKAHMRRFKAFMIIVFSSTTSFFEISHDGYM
jgi:hypothetical protein